MHEFVDVGVSGAKEKRPELDKLMKYSWGMQFLNRLGNFGRSENTICS
jgi:hypothetical protein